MTLNDKLSQYDISPDPERSQYFLHNDLIIDRMIEEAELSEDDTVLEIGAGIGTITKQLAEHAGTVLAFENDAALIEALEQEVQEYENVEIHDRDVLHSHVPEFDKCVSNIPFHLSSEIVEFLGERQKPSVLLVQEAFADRLVAEPGSSEYGQITVRARYYMIPVFVEQVLDINFTPSPETNAAIVKLFPRKDRFDVENEPFFFHTANALFTHKKKKTRNAFYDSRHMFDLKKETARELQDWIPHSEKRVFELDVAEVVDIANALDDRLNV